MVKVSKELQQAENLPFCPIDAAFFFYYNSAVWLPVIWTYESKTNIKFQIPEYMPWIDCIVNAGKAGYTTRTINAYCEKAAKRIIVFENEIN